MPINYIVFIENCLGAKKRFNVYGCDHSFSNNYMNFKTTDVGYGVELKSSNSSSRIIILQDSNILTKFKTQIHISLYHPSNAMF